MPICNVRGNHDSNSESPTHRYATQTYSRYFGPTDFSFNHGDTHWIGADNIDDGDDDRPSHGYVFDAQQLTWVHNDLEFVPKDKLIVIVTHFPLVTYALDENAERYSMGGNINTINLPQLVEIRARRFDPNGTPASDELPVNTAGPGDQVAPTVERQRLHRLANSQAGHLDLHARSFSITTGIQNGPTSARNGTGAFAAAWHSKEPATGTSPPERERCTQGAPRTDPCARKHPPPRRAR